MIKLRRITKFLFCESKNVDKKNVTVDVETIKKRLMDRKTELPFKDPTIKKPSDFYDAKSNKRKSEYVFDFINPKLNNKPYLQQVFGLGNGYFSVNDTWYPGSILIFPHQIFLWDVQTAADIRAHSFDILEVIKPRPSYVLIGTGREKNELPDSYFEKFRKFGIKVDVVATFEACSHFNFCSEEARDVCAFMIPQNL